MPSESINPDDELERLQHLSADDFDCEETEEEGLSLEELSQTYAQVLQLPVKSPSSSELATGSETTGLQVFDPLEEELSDSDDCPITPRSILEAVLMVGRPDSGPITAREIASLMRGVTETEVDVLVDELNQQYAESGSAMYIAGVSGGYRMQLASDLKVILDRFYGPTREVKLNQAAIDCLALVSYQPGITREKLDEQRGQSSGSVLNQLVRRELIEMRREGKGKAVVPHYYPTERLLDLAGLESLDDLPHAEEW